MERILGTKIQGEHVALIIEEKVEVRRPNLYKVLMLNDDCTPMDFVVLIVQNIFGKSLEESTSIMLEVHNNGKGVAGIYTYDVARTKVKQVHSLAKKNQYPLQCILDVESHA